ncbi:MAG: family 78 glycoside hydrolase catalytic domain [Salinibacter sp.]
MHNQFWLVLGVLLTAGAVSATAARPAPDPGGLEVASLRTNHKATPMGIDGQTPCLAWTLAASARGARQTAYRIQVAETRSALNDGENLVWDSGKVNTDQSAHHAYSGPTLAPRTRYYWRVRVWDGDGQPSDWSEVSWWEMGLLEPADWEAEWIEPGWNKDSSEPLPSPMLRTEFSVDGTVASARLYVTSHGLYEMHLNGRRVGNRLFTPGWTSYDHRLQYQTYDVTDLLSSGTNAIGAVLGDGWYRGYIGFQGQRNYYGDTLALLAQLHVTYEDGRTEVVVRTDDGWRATTGPIRKSDIYMGETYDARKEKTGWTQAEYDPSGWSGVRGAQHGMDRLLAQTAPPVRRIQEIKPKEVLVTPEGDTVLDMGQNMVGWMRMRVEGEAGTQVTLQHAEVLDKEGNFYTKNLRSAKQTDRFILDGEGTEVFEPHFTFHGFRYVKVSGYPGEVEPDDFTGVVIHSDMRPTGHFQSSHARLNQLQHNIVWGQKGNFLDIPTDCPQRDERLGWTGDIQVFARTANFNMDTVNFLRKWLRDLAADQLPSGSVPHVVPNVLGKNSAGAAGWADASVVVPWALYQAYGNKQILEAQYESMTGWVEFVRRRAAMDSTTYLWENNPTFGDWLAYNTDQSDYPGATTSKDLIRNAYFARSADLLARSARALGRMDDAKRYQQLFEDVRAAFQREFVTPRGRVTSDTQTSYVLALSFDLLPTDLRATAAKRLAQDVRERGHLTTGFLGTPDLTHVLSEYGYREEAFDLLFRTEYPSWLYPITMGATTMWEHWDGIKPDSTFQDPSMNSYNHYAYGAVGEWLYTEVAGLQAAAPGYEEIRVAPHPGDTLTHARAVLDTNYGRLESSWTRSDGQFRLSVTIPANTQATVRLPGAARTAVTESGTPLDAATGITTVRADGEDRVLDVGSGEYTFEYAYDPSPDADDRAPPGPDATVGELLAHPETRNVLQETMPEVVTSPWLSQAMGFSLGRLPRIVPVEVSDEALQSVRRRLQQLGR